MGSTTIDVVPYNGALAIVDLLTAGQTIVLGDFGTVQSGILTDADGTLGSADDGIATFSSQPVTYIGSGTATPGVAVPGLGTVPLGASVDLVAFEAGGQVYFHYPDGDLDFTGAIAVVIDIDTTPYPLFTPVCFQSGTLLSTPEGECPAESLKPGDWLLDIYGAAHRVTWTGHRRVQLDSCGPRARSRLAPIVIPPNLLHGYRPARELRLSRQHLLLIRHHLCSFFFGEDQLLIPAAALLGNGASVDMETCCVTYIHIMCENHVILRANGMAAETFLPGPQAIAALTPRQRISLLSQPCQRDRASDMTAAAPVLSMRDAKFLISEITMTAHAAQNTQGAKNFTIKKQ